MNPQKRLKYLIEDVLNLSQKDFAEQIGVSRQTINHVIAEKHKMSINTLQLILQRYPNLNMNWLLNGGAHIWRDEEIKAYKEKIRAMDEDMHEAIKTLEFTQEQLIVYKHLVRVMEESSKKSN